MLLKLEVKVGAVFLHYAHWVIRSSLVLLAKGNGLSAVVGGVISSSSGVDGWSLDIFIPSPVHQHG